MKKVLTGIFYLCIIVATALVACKKEDFKQEPQPVSNEFQLVIDVLPGEGGNSVADLFTIVSIKKGNTDEEIISNKKLAFTYNGKYISEKIKLADGAYKVTKLLIVNGAGKVRFAAPVANSPKASSVQKPLGIDFTLPKPTRLQLPVEVLKIENTDKPENFGYPAGTFNEQPNMPVEMFKVTLKAIATIGTINYDSIPANFRITTWDANNVAHVKDTALAAGANEILLPKSHVRFQFKLNKWGITDEITLTREQINEGTTYQLGGSKAAKKLRLEETFLFAAGNYQPSSKTVYSYNGNGSLGGVEFFQKLPQHSDLRFTHKNVYLYAGSNVSRINTIEADGKASGFIEFTYNAQGTKVVNMHRKNYDQETGAAVDYSYPAGHALITIHYLYNNGKTMEYKMKFVGGNKIEDAAVSSNGSEGGTYTYDLNINPYVHMNIPNIFLSNLSKNNLVQQQKGYSGGFPSGDLYKIEYNYDADGYPVEAIKYYKSYLNGQDLYKTKTIYTY